MSKKKAPTPATTTTAPPQPAVKAEASKPTTAKAAAAKPAEPAVATAPVAAKAAVTTTPAKAAAVKSAEPAVATAPVAAKAAATKPASAKPAPPAKAKEEKAVSKPKAAPKAATTTATTSIKSASAVVTVVIAKYDAGYGNNLHIRGNSAGLNWENGVLMKNVENDVWVWTTNEALHEAVEFKLLLNDQEWCAGENMSAPAGETTTIAPTF